MHDYHTHLWPHEPGTEVPTYDELADRCETAAAAGVEVVAVTEHASRFEAIAELARRYWRRPGPAALDAAADHVWGAERGGDLDRYVEALVAARERGLPLRIGLEVDHLPGADEAIGRLLAGYPFDVLLGSVHWLGPWLFDAYGTPAFAAEWTRRSVDDAFDDYAAAVAQLVSVCDVDVVAHLDVIKVAGHQPSDTAGFHRRLTETVVGSGVAVEISSAGWRKPIDELYPAPALLAMLAERGVRFTTASDAHVPDQIGHRFADLVATARTAGVTEFVTFDRRRPAVAPLPSAE